MWYVVVCVCAWYVHGVCLWHIYNKKDTLVVWSENEILVISGTLEIKGNLTHPLPKSLFCNDGAVGRDKQKKICT